MTWDQVDELELAVAADLTAFVRRDEELLKLRRRRPAKQGRWRRMGPAMRERVGALLGADLAVKRLWHTVRTLREEELRGWPQEDLNLLWGALVLNNAFDTLHGQCDLATLYAELDSAEPTEWRRCA